jgi:hypothetical protein
MRHTAPLTKVRPTTPSLGPVTWEDSRSPFCLGGYPMAEKSPPSTQHHQRSQAMREALKVFSDFLTEEVLLEIQNAAADADIHKYLESKRITIPEGISISVLQAPPTEMSATPSGLYVAPPPPVCPAGQVPVLVRETVTRCTDTREVVVVPKNSTTFPIDPHNPLPLPEPPRIIGHICVAWGTVEVLRWYCRAAPVAWPWRP